MITAMEQIDFILKQGAKNGMSLSKFIALQIEEFKQSPQYKEMIIGSKYYKNEGDVKNKQRTYIDENGQEQVSPHAKNYQLNHSILHKLINQKTGYLVRERPTIKQTIEEGQKEDNGYQREIKGIFNEKMHKRLKYTVNEITKRAITWWQVYIDKNGEFKTRLRYGTRIVPIWKDEEHEELDAIIMFYDVEVYTDNGNKETKTKVEYYDEDGVRYYIYEGNDLIQDIEEVEKRNHLILGKDTEGVSILGHFEINDTPKIWNKGIPFIYFKYNAEELPLIHFLKNLIDCYDELCSITGDSIFEAPEGVDIVKNYDEEVETFKKNLKTYGSIFMGPDGEYDRVNITLNIDAFKVFIEQLRKDIYEGGSGVDTQSEKFGTQISGVALKQLYSDLDLDCSNIETELKSSLQHFKGFFDEWIIIKDNKDYSDIELEWIFNKTMTVNEKEIIENCNNSINVLSRKSILANHPYVTNVEAELKNIKDEKEEEQAELDSEYNKLFKKMNNKNNNIENTKVGDVNE